MIHWITQIRCQTNYNLNKQYLPVPLGTASPVVDNLVRAGSVELVLPVCSANTPVLLVHGLSVVTSAVGLPRLVVGLEVEQVHTPGEHAADGALPVGLGILRASLGSFVVGAAV